MSFAITALAGTNMLQIGAIALTLIALLYVGGPLLSLATHKQPARLEASALLSLDVVSQIEADVAPALQDAASQLAALGFVTGSPLRAPTAENSVAFAIIGEAPNGDLAESWVLVRKTEQQVIRRNWTSFHSQTRNFARTITSNAVSASGIPSAGGRTAFSAPAMMDLAQLYRLHAIRVADSGGRRRGAPALGGQAAFVESEWAISTENMVARGYARRSGSDGATIRLTAKGAFLIGWRQLPPWKEIAASKARRRLAELEARVPIDAPLARSA